MKDNLSQQSQEAFSNSEAFFLAELKDWAKCLFDPNLVKNIPSKQFTLQALEDFTNEAQSNKDYKTLLRLFSNLIQAIVTNSEQFLLRGQLLQLEKEIGLKKLIESNHLDFTLDFFRYAYCIFTLSTEKLTQESFDAVLKQLNKIDLSENGPLYRYCYQKNNFNLYSECYQLRELFEKSIEQTGDLQILKYKIKEFLVFKSEQSPETENIQEKEFATFPIVEKLDPPTSKSKRKSTITAESSRVLRALSYSLDDMLSQSSIDIKIPEAEEAPAKNLAQTPAHKKIQKMEKAAWENKTLWDILVRAKSSQQNPEADCVSLKRVEEIIDQYHRDKGSLRKTFDRFTATTTIEHLEWLCIVVKANAKPGLTDDKIFINKSLIEDILKLSDVRQHQRFFTCVRKGSHKAMRYSFFADRARYSEEENPKPLSATEKAIEQLALAFNKIDNDSNEASFPITAFSI